jgi:uncharacterized protein YcaQ
VDLSSEEARWLTLGAQGLADPRPVDQVGGARLLEAFRAVGVVQLDAINVVARTQFLVLFSRLGCYEIDRLHEMTGPGGELFEYWGRAASLLPVAHQPLFRWRMDTHGPYGDSPKYVARREEWRAANAGYIDAVLREVRDRGALTAAQLTDPRRRDGEWWERRSVGRLALEWLFAKGELAAWRTARFERVYDLPERVIPAAVLAQTTPSVDGAHRTLITMAARSLGVATLNDLAGYYGLKPQTTRARVAELLETGDLLPAMVEGWAEAAYLVPGVEATRPSRHDATLLSPFDSLIWDRNRTRRLFGFDFRIEVYVRRPDRQFGYYVLPLLIGDRLVGRLDLKADRKGSTLRVAGAYVERGADTASAATSAAAELTRLRQWLRLNDIAVERRGNLAAKLERAAR